MTSPSRWAWPLGTWAGLYLLAVVLVRDYHPTWAVDLLATLALLGSYAAAIALDRRALAGLRERRGIVAYLAGLVALMVGLTLVAVGAIQGVYWLLWHPDPGRFGFRTNFATDFLGMVLFVTAASCIARASRRK